MDKHKRVVYVDKQLWIDTQMYCLRWQKIVGRHTNVLSTLTNIDLVSTANNYNCNILLSRKNVTAMKRRMRFEFSLKNIIRWRGSNVCLTLFFWLCLRTHTNSCGLPANLSWSSYTWTNVDFLEFLARLWTLAYLRFSVDLRTLLVWKLVTTAASLDRGWCSVRICHP